MSSNWRFFGTAEVMAAHRVYVPDAVFDEGILSRPGEARDAAAVWSYHTESGTAVLSGFEPETDEIIKIKEISIGGKRDAFRVTVPKELFSDLKNGTKQQLKFADEEAPFEVNQELSFLSKREIIASENPSVLVVGASVVETLMSCSEEGETIRRLVPE